LYTYPDITIVCGDPQFEDQREDTLTNPTVIIEVLSPSTKGYARHIKFAHYRQLPSLTDYVLVAEDTMMVEHFARSGDRDDQWLLTKLSDPDSILSLTSIGCDIKLRDIYNKVKFPNSEPAG
jgi:Uma2 family endonuclease